MKTKRAWYCIEAIKKWEITVNEITDYVSKRRWFKVSDRIIYMDLVSLRNKWYIKSTRQGNKTYWSILKDVNSQVEIKL